MMCPKAKLLLGCGFGTLCLGLNCPGGLSAFALDFNAAGFCFRPLWQRNAQNPISVIGCRPFGRNCIRQSERAQERTIRPLYPVVVVGLFLLFEMSLAPKRNHVVFN